MSSPKLSDDDGQLRSDESDGRDREADSVGRLLLALFDGFAAVALLGLPVLVALVSAPGRAADLKLAAIAAVVTATATVAGQRLGRLPAAEVLRPSTFAVGGYRRALTRGLGLSLAVGLGAYGGRAVTAMGADAGVVVAVAAGVAGLSVLGESRLAGSGPRASGRRIVAFGVGVALLTAALYAPPANPLARPVTALYATLWFVDGLPTLFAAGRALGFGADP